MPGKKNIRATRERRQREAVFGLYQRGFAVEQIASKLGTNEKRVRRTLTAIGIKLTDNDEATKGWKDNMSDREWLDQQRERFDRLQQEINQLKAEREVLALEQAEERILLLSQQGYRFPAAFEQVLEDLDARELAAKAQRDEAKAERTRLELEEMSETEEMRILMEQEEGH